MSPVQYAAILAQRGFEELDRMVETLSFSSKVNTVAGLVYKRDYDLGDRVTCISKRWGVKINPRITEISETYEANRQEIHITFGSSLPTLFDKIRQIR